MTYFQRLSFNTDTVLNNNERDVNTVTSEQQSRLTAHRVGFLM